MLAAISVFWLDLAGKENKLLMSTYYITPYDDVKLFFCPFNMVIVLIFIGESKISALFIEKMLRK